ncbi:hypothetical protein [Dyadobacter fermentans]|uniref:hypothetical protein n=1 Tax=Dyadobacter fermentans TaxID=94254 RepID=UPI001CBCF315|nr:hypothetical protein [Dyadobacter fermentans]MBZ1362017.1 hypothetical protein [Dyadobacter fermentans]
MKLKNMLTSQENTSMRLKNMLRCTTILALILLSVPGLAQKSTLTPSEKRIAYENALLDSAYRYEKLKLAFIPLKTAYEYQGKENEELRATVRLQNLQASVQKQSFEAAISKTKQEGGFWRGFKWGLGTGYAGGLLTGLRVRK